MSQSGGANNAASTPTPIRPSAAVHTDAHHHHQHTPTSSSSSATMSGQHSSSHHDLTSSASSAAQNAAAAAAAVTASMSSSTTVSSGTPPTAGFRHSSEKKSGGRPAMKVLLPKLPSSDSLSGTSIGAPSSPGLTNWADSSPRIEVASMEKESYKAQRKNYRREKKRVASELLNSLQDPAIIVLADWLKVRGTLKSWTKLWCVLKPGLLLLYKSPKTKSSQWVGTILLTSCQIIERPSKKDGFCFKLFHPLDQTIWAPRGPDKESIGAVVQPLPTAYLIFRAPSQAAGKCWLDALELSLRCSALLLRSASGSGNHADLVLDDGAADEAVAALDAAAGVGDGLSGAGAVASLLVVAGAGCGDPELGAASLTMAHESSQWSEADYEKHFHDHDLDVDSQTDGATAVMSGLDSDSESEDDTLPETPYVFAPEEEFGEAGEQVEELAEENKSLIWYVVKQVRPGMDLSKVVLPTFILEPRSFLDKLADSYYHADYLSQAVLEDDPFTRMKLVVKWYLSGFYKKPRGLKKPYNPCLGEKFRCYWEHANGSRTFYIAEQVSHHPPVSAFYVTNRQDGFAISCSMLAKSKFYGNSTSAILDGTATLTLLPRGESYTLTIPYAHCKGILMGTLSMELGGKVAIECENTGYTADIEFKLKPLFGGAEYTNVVTARLRLGKETLANLKGHWDGEIVIKDARSGEESVLFAPSGEVRKQRLRRFTVQLDAQGNESERMWRHVSAAIEREDQVAATEEKTALEDAQRTLVKERQATCTEWQPELFQQDIVTGQWHYKWADLRPWDTRTDERQYEAGYQIRTKTCLLTPLVRTASIINADPIILQADHHHGHHRGHRKGGSGMVRRVVGVRKVSMVELCSDHGSDSSHSTTGGGGARGGGGNGVVDDLGGGGGAMGGAAKSKILDSLFQINHRLDEQTVTLAAVKVALDKLTAATSAAAKRRATPGAAMQLTEQLKSVLCVLLGILIQSMLTWLFGGGGRM